jgi:predicted enzyme related to lactoylglutathione lyase
MKAIYSVLAVAVIAGAAGGMAQKDVETVRYRPNLLIQLPVSDLERSIAFYSTVLGFTMTERRDDLKFAHIDTNVPGLQIGLNQVPEPKGTGSVILNIGVADVIVARKTLETRGVKFRGETVVIPGKVALARFDDPDGHALSLAGPPKK